MTPEKLASIRAELISGNTTSIEDFYLSYRKDCENVLLSKNLSNSEGAIDIFTDALLILRQNLISGKIEELSSVRSYLISTCINIARKEIQYQRKTQKKLDDVRLLFYHNKYTSTEEHEIKADLIDLSKLAMSKLTERCQRIIIAFFVYQLSMKEIAEELELSSKDVAKTLKSRCYKYLLKEVEKLRSK